MLIYIHNIYNYAIFNKTTYFIINTTIIHYYYGPYMNDTEQKQHKQNRGCI